MSRRYEYPLRSQFEQKLREAGFKSLTSQVYASSIANPKTTTYSTAKATWKRLMGDAPIPEPQKNLWNSAPRENYSRPSGMEYNKPKLPETQPTVEKETIVETPQDPKLQAIQTILALEGISDAVKVQMIALLFS